MDLGKKDNEIAPARLAKYLIKNPKAYRIIQNNFSLVRKEITQGKWKLINYIMYLVC